MNPAAREAWVVGARGAGADHDGITGPAQAVHRATRQRPGQPAASTATREAAGRRDAAVERGGELERDARAPGRVEPPITAQQLARVGGEQSDLDPHARGAQAA